MANKDKRKKHFENLKHAILDAAKTLFLMEGYKNTSMRKIAAEVGISPTTIYLYYKDKAEIMHALHQEGFKLLTGQFKTLQYVQDPFERLKAMGRCYINFSLENHGFYEIMFVMKEPLEHLNNTPECDGWEEGEAAFQALLSAVGACQEAGYFKDIELHELALLLWSNLHGLCSLKSSGHLDLLTKKINEQADVSKILQESFELYASMIEKI